MRPAPPVAPPVMGFTGANPVRAMEAMQGGVTRTPFAPSQPAPSNGPVFTGAPPPRVPASVFNPLTNVGEFYNPKTMVTFAPGKPVQTPYRDAAPGPAPNAPPVPTYSAPAPTQTMASAPSPVANTAALAPQLPRTTTAAARGGLLGVANAARTTPVASAPTAGMSAGAPSGTMMSGGKPAVPAITPTVGSKTDGASAFGGSTATREPPTSGFLAYNAADPNRALKMMRGF